MKKILTLCCVILGLSVVAFAAKPVDQNLAEPQQAKALYISQQNGGTLDKDQSALVEKYYGNRGEPGNGLDAQGGPDGSFYYFVDNQPTDTSGFNWIELYGDPGATQVTAVSGGSTDDGYVNLTIPFSFPFYGSSYTATMPRVKRRLREVQEVLAQGDFKIARFYYSKGAMRAAQSRFQEIADRYPDFSRVDNALWYLGQSLERLRRAHDAAPYYARIITDHPLSPLVGDAKERLTALHQPIPRPTRAMLARAQADAASRAGKDLFQKMGGFLSSGPDTSATRRGPVRLGGPKPSEVEVAKAPEPTPGTSSIVVQPVGEDRLKAGKPVGSTPSGASGSGGAPTTPQEPIDGQKPATGASGSNSQTPDPTPPAKKKAKRSLFKRIIKPF